MYEIQEGVFVAGSSGDNQEPKGGRVDETIVGGEGGASENTKS